MNAPFELTPQAAEDLDAIWWFIADDSRDAANRVEAEIVGSCRRLAKYPLHARMASAVAIDDGETAAASSRWREHWRSPWERLWRQKPAPGDRRSAVAAGRSACATSYQRLASGLPYAKMPLTTFPAIPVNRASSPWNFTVSRLWSMPSKCSIVA